MTDAPDWAGAAGLVSGFGQAYTRQFAIDHRNISTASGGAAFAIVAAQGAGLATYLARARVMAVGAANSSQDLNPEASLFGAAFSWRSGNVGTVLARGWIDTTVPMFEREYAVGAVVTAANTALYLDLILDQFGDGFVLTTEVDYYVQ